MKNHHFPMVFPWFSPHFIRHRSPTPDSALLGFAHGTQQTHCALRTVATVAQDLAGRMVGLDRAGTKGPKNEGMAQPWKEIWHQGKNMVLSIGNLGVQWFSPGFNHQSWDLTRFNHILLIKIGASHYFMIKKLYDYGDWPCHPPNHRMKLWWTPGQ